MQKLFRLACQERGSTLVEFAMTALMLMGLMIGIIGFALAMYTYHSVSSAAQLGMRFAQVRGYTWSKSSTTDCGTSPPPNFTMKYDCTALGSDIQNFVQSQATGGITPGNLTITTTSSYLWPGKTPDGTTTPCSPTNSQGCLVKVTVNYTFDFFKLFPLGNLSNLSITATSEGAILQ